MFSIWPARRLYKREDIYFRKESLESNQFLAGNQPKEF
jgi:hypothetical protein